MGSILENLNGLKSRNLDLRQRKSGEGIYRSKTECQEQVRVQTQRRIAKKKKRVETCYTKSFNSFVLFRV